MCIGEGAVDNPHAQTMSFALEPARLTHNPSLTPPSYRFLPGPGRHSEEWEAAAESGAASRSGPPVCRYIWLHQVARGEALRWQGWRLSLSLLLLLLATNSFELNESPYAVMPIHNTCSTCNPQTLPEWACNGCIVKVSNIFKVWQARTQGGQYQHAGYT